MAKSPLLQALGLYLYKEGGGCLYLFHWWDQILQVDPEIYKEIPGTYKQAPWTLQLNP
jgi:hypothetical protein